LGTADDVVKFAESRGFRAVTEDGVVMLYVPKEEYDNWGRLRKEVIANTGYDQSLGCRIEKKEKET